MKSIASTAGKRHSGETRPQGFALVITLSLMVLLTIVAVGLLSLSAISLRGGSQEDARAVARANARLALMVALGELQKEMGPDMRVSAKSALFDSSKESESIEGVAQSQWLASYDAWGDWLTASYSPPDGASLRISDTYAPRREKMFRRWLLSLPEGKETDIDAPDSLGGWDKSNSVELVGAGTLGDSADRHPDRLTRAYLVPVGDSGRNAWWIGPENQKASVNLASRSRNLDAAASETSHGNTAEVGVGSLEGFTALDDDATLSDRLITQDTLRPAQISKDKVQEGFFDLTASSRGVLASVRGGHLKKDLSLLFEQSSLPSPYRFNPGSDVREPSIRPMSGELLAKKPAIPNRHFASWTNMRHFYRMYRSKSDATIGGTNGSGSITWSGTKPGTGMVSSTNLGSVGVGTGGADWDGSNHYWRVPILAKITFIYSLVAEPSAAQPGKFDCFHVYSPVFTFWNPYNVEMRVPDNKIDYLTSAYKVWPNSGSFWLGKTLVKDADQMGAFGQFGYSQGVVTRSYLRSGASGDIVFKPGEFRVFSLASTISNGTEASAADLLPGFNPQAIGGEKKLYGTYSAEESPGITVEFSHNYWGGNINYGNTCGSLCMISWWDRKNSSAGTIPINYAVDWLNKAQRKTPITLAGANNVRRWIFDGRPEPVAFCQLVVKGLSEFNYESIDWEKDWRSRNWIQAPPFYFGSGMYASENETTAHTQRVDSPYVVFFGPTSMAEMPKVVAQIGSSAFLGSGSAPYEKVTSAPMLELPTAPVGSLAGFSNMRINPGWLRTDQMGGQIKVPTYGGSGVTSTGEESLHAADTKRVSYQNGITGPGIGNSFMHPMLSRQDVYQYSDNSKSEDIPDRNQPDNTKQNDSKAFNDYWDHVFLLNDALWDDYFVSSLADQRRPGATAAASLSENVDRLIAGGALPNSRFRYHSAGGAPALARAELEAANGYLKAARHLMVDGMFNVNSTSVTAWQALFAGIRERDLVYRDSSGGLRKIEIPSGKRIAISRFNTEVSGEEMDDAEFGVNLPDNSAGWSGVRFLGDDQLRRLAEECVKQVKLRGPFLNFSEFINRRLSDDDLGTMGALQSAIDFDDDSPDPASINYRYKKGSGFMIKAGNLGKTEFRTPEAAEGSRFAGIPGYVIQSDLLKPIANTLSVRDDTFRIRAYGDARDPDGKVTARAWCEAIVQRLPEYLDPGNTPDVPVRELDTAGRFKDNSALTATNRRFGRKLEIESFRWLNPDEI